MFRAITFFVILACSALLAFTTQQEHPRLLWSDEFDNDGLPDPSHWTYDTGDGCPKACGWGNNELQYYTQAVKKNARVEKGKLIIEAHREPMGKQQYTSARMKSKMNGWKYGYIEVSAKLPQGRGTWPAIWMLPDTMRYGGWPHCGEIDIMEHVGYDPGMVHGTVHTGKYNHIMNTQSGNQAAVDHYNTAFHTYAINWTKDNIEFFIDGTSYHTFHNNGEGPEAWPFDHPFHLILNIAVGGGWGGREGIDDSIWPQRMEVEYVRVYEPLVTPEQRRAMMGYSD